MRYRLAIIVLTAGTQLSAQSASIDLATARLYFNEVQQLNREDSGRLWGRPVAGPMLFVDPESGFLVANQSDRDKTFEARDGVWIGKLPDGLSPANTGIDLGGTRWAMIMWPVPDNRYARRRLLMHESFHRIQDSLQLPGFNPSNAHLAGAEARIWLRLEMRALAEALLRSGNARCDAIHDALTFRAKRWSVFPDVADEERQLEINEGLAEYTGIMLSGLPASAIADRIAVQLAQQEQQESQSRSFAYATGPAYAALLDASGVSWRRRLNAKTNLAAEAIAAFGLRTVRDSDADSLVAVYTGARMVAFERTREAGRVAKEAELRARFLTGSALRLPVGTRFNFSFDPNGAVPLPGVGTVYEASRISDEWGSLEVTSGGVLIQRNDKGRITGVIVTSPMVKDGIVGGEGWKLTLADGWKVSQSPTKPGYFLVSRI